MNGIENVWRRKENGKNEWESGKCCVSGGVVLIYMYINLTKAHFQMEFGTEPKFEQRFAVRLHG